MSLMTRRKFAGHVGLAGLAGLGGMLKVGWSQPHGPKHDEPQKPEQIDSPGPHIANRRLLDFADGYLKLVDWERQHLHDCHVCQALVCVFIRQPF